MKILFGLWSNQKKVVTCGNIGNINLKRLKMLLNAFNFNGIANKMCDKRVTYLKLYEIACVLKRIA